MKKDTIKMYKQQSREQFKNVRTGSRVINPKKTKAEKYKKYIDEDDLLDEEQEDFFFWKNQS